jgi:hypothetical protein
MHTASVDAVPDLLPVAGARYFSPVATVPADLKVHPLGGEPLTMSDQVTMFHLAAVVLDPYTYESAWLLETAGRILEEFAEADCRTAWIVTADEKDAEAFLGPWAQRFLTLCDPERAVVQALEVNEIPALVHIGNDLSIIGKAEGWDPEQWRPITDNLAKMMSWSRPVFPKTGDPLAFAGSPAAG